MSSGEALINEIMVGIKLYDSVTPQFGPKKKMAVTFYCDGVEMSVSSAAVDSKFFVMDDHVNQVKSKLGTFIENRPNAIIKVESNG